MFCPNCKAEYREGFTKCHDCQIDLIVELPKEKKPEPDPDIRFVEVLRTDNQVDISFIKGLLDSKGFHYFLKGENMKFIRAVDPVVLMVLEDEADEVRELLRDSGLRYSAFVF